MGGANDDTRRSVAPTITIATHNMGEDEGRKKRTRNREGTGWQFFFEKKKNKWVKSKILSFFYAYVHNS